MDLSLRRRRRRREPPTGRAHAADTACGAVSARRVRRKDVVLLVQGLVLGPPGAFQLPPVLADRAPVEPHQSAQRAGEQEQSQHDSDRHVESVHGSSLRQVSNRRQALVERPRNMSVRRRRDEPTSLGVRIEGCRGTFALSNTYTAAAQHPCGPGLHGPRSSGRLLTQQSLVRRSNRSVVTCLSIGTYRAKCPYEFGAVYFGASTTPSLPAG